MTELEKALPRYRERLSVLPGITGLARVQLPPDTELADVQVKLAHDLCYVERGKALAGRADPGGDRVDAGRRAL